MNNIQVIISAHKEIKLVTQSEIYVYMCVRDDYHHFSLTVSSKRSSTDNNTIMYDEVFSFETLVRTF